LLPFKRAEVRDEHHDLFGQNIADTALVFPSCVGSTYTGLVLLELVSRGRAPAALVVQKADPLLTSGIIVSDVWYEKSIPVLEHPGEDVFDAIRTGDRVRIESGVGEIFIERSSSAT
jgi:predicted aconitase with swiveling domain